MSEMLLAFAAAWLSPEVPESVIASWVSRFFVVLGAGTDLLMTLPSVLPN